MIGLGQARRINRSGDKSHFHQSRGHGGATDYEETATPDAAIRRSGRHIHHLLLQVRRQTSRAGVREEEGLNPVHIRTIHAQRIGMDAHERSGSDAIRQGYPWRKVNIHFAGPRQANINATSTQQGRNLQRNIENHIGLPQTANADRPWIGSTVTGINHHAVAVAGHRGQPGRIHGRSGWTESGGRLPGRGPATHIALTEVI